MGGDEEDGWSDAGERKRQDEGGFLNGGRRGQEEERWTQGRHRISAEWEAEIIDAFDDSGEAASGVHAYTPSLL